jgi:hypothetical protein
MKKVLSAFGVLGAALVLLAAPVSAQTPSNITATITATANPTAGTQILVTAVFSIPSLSTSPAEVSISTSGGGTPALVSFTPGLSSCVTATDAVRCTWSTPDSAAPQTLVVEVPATASGITFNANAGPPGQLTQKATTSVSVVQPTTTTTVAGATTTTATTVTPATTAATTTVAPTTTAAGTLPATGSNSDAPLVIALVAIAAGVLLVGGARLLKSRG